MSEGMVWEGMVWEDPPLMPGGRRPRWTKAFAARCAEHPGKWARVVTPDGEELFNQGTMTSLRNWGLEVRATSFEADSTRLPKGKFRMWARWPDA